MNIFVSNVNYGTSEDQLRELFEQYGEVSSIKIIQDRETGRPKGFGFVEMSDEDGQNAINALHQKDFNQRTLNVVEAKPREEKPARSFNQRRYNNNNNNNSNW